MQMTEFLTAEDFQSILDAIPAPFSDLATRILRLDWKELIFLVAICITAASRWIRFGAWGAVKVWRGGRFGLGLVGNLVSNLIVMIGWAMKSGLVNLQPKLSDLGKEMLELLHQINTDPGSTAFPRLHLVEYGSLQAILHPEGYSNTCYYWNNENVTDLLTPRDRRILFNECHSLIKEHDKKVAQRKEMQDTKSREQRVLEIRKARLSLPETPLPAAQDKPVTKDTKGSSDQGKPPQPTVVDSAAAVNNARLEDFKRVVATEPIIVVSGSTNQHATSGSTLANNRTK